MRLKSRLMPAFFLDLRLLLRGDDLLVRYCDRVNAVLVAIIDLANLSARDFVFV